MTYNPYMASCLPLRTLATTHSPLRTPLSVVLCTSECDAFVVVVDADAPSQHHVATGAHQPLNVYPWQTLLQSCPRQDSDKCRVHASSWLSMFLRT